MKAEDILISLAIVGVRTAFGFIGNNLIRKYEAEGHFLKCLVYISYICSDMYVFTMFINPLTLSSIIADCIYLYQGVISYLDWKKNPRK